MRKQASQKAATTYMDLLKEDHKKVKANFKKFEKTENKREKQRLVTETLMELYIHAKVEEQVVYPALREVVEMDLMDEADQEHHIAKVLMAELADMTPDDDQYDAKFTVLGEIIDHHVEEEEGEILPKARKTAVAEITAQVLEQKEILKSRYAEELLKEDALSMTR